MKKIDIDTWAYLNCFIMKFEHPKLVGKYEAFRDDPEETRIGTRFCTLAEAKKIIKKLNQG